MTQAEPTPEKPARSNRTRRRILTGCGTLLWFIFLLVPCGFFFFASQGEINLQHDYVPNAYAHPLLQVSLIMDKDNRGFQVNRSVISQNSDNLCVTTIVSYLLWEQDSRENQNVVICDCYVPVTSDADSVTDNETVSADVAWQLGETYTGTCNLPER